LLPSSEKYESQLGLLFLIYEKHIHVPNHQPVTDKPQLIAAGDSFPSI
jgi:hypothetical protein